MEGGPDVNHHFKQLTNGVPGDVLGPLGEALLAVNAQRNGEKVDSPALLRKAWFALARWLIQNVGMAMNPQQRAFLLAGAIGDSVTLKNRDGQRVTVDLIPAADYERLLEDLEATGQACLLTPKRRFAKLANGEMGALDLNKPGKYKEPTQAEKKTVDPEVFVNRLKSSMARLNESKDSLEGGLREFLGLLQADKLKGIIGTSTELKDLMDKIIQMAANPGALSALNLPRDVEANPAVKSAREMRGNITATLDKLIVAEQNGLRAMQAVRDAAAALVKVQEGGAASVTVEDAVELTPQTARMVESDYNAVNGVMVQLLNNSPQRTPWSASRILLAEHTEKFDDPVAECYATPANLAASIEKIDALHPNCFPHDGAGAPLMPPIVIEPGAGIVQWYDDRFIMSFVCTEQARKGAKLTFTPVDLAVLQMYGQFLARGDLYNYRGERVTGNFIGDYAGEVESKAKIKFTGADKKMTIVSATELKDAAGREDAVKDYVDFLFHIFNGLNLPKRITPRRVATILKYCIIQDHQFSANLVLRHVVNYDNKVARDIITNLADKNDVRIIDYFRNALEEDPQVAAKYRRDLKRAVQEVMGREFLADAEHDGLFGGQRPTTDLTNVPTGDQAETADSGHDFFDV